MKYTFTNVEVEAAGLKITATDATNEHFPVNTSAGTPDEEGKQFYFRPVKRRETKWDLYCTKLGAALARELKKVNKDIVIQQGKFVYNFKNCKFMAQLNFFFILIFSDALVDLPKGYQL